MLVSAGLVSVADRFDDATIQIWEPVVRSNGFIRHAHGDMSEAFFLLRFGSVVSCPSGYSRRSEYLLIDSYDEIDCR
jgi:hypothetical protein